MPALHEWGATKHDARRLFENLVLEGAQASLGWMTILSKREKINSAIENAISLINIPEIFGSFDAQIWGFAAGIKTCCPYYDGTLAESAVN